MKFLQKRQKRIYLDYAAATPLRHTVAQKMRVFERDMFANASAIHREGVLVRQAVNRARERLARTLKIRPNGVVFTGSGTESNNLAIMGAVEARRATGVPYVDMEVISTHIEHPSVSKVLEHLSELGVDIKYLDIDTEGLIVAQSLLDTLSEKTVMVSFAYANSEIGVVQEVGKLSRIVRAFEKEHATRTYVHTDAAQAPLYLNCEMDRLMADIITFDAGKCYGPKGVGVLAMRHGVELSSVLYGGPQESGLRPATENTAGIIGAVEAIVVAQEQHEKRAEKVSALRDKAITQLSTIEGVVLNGSRTQRIANNINISISGIDSEFAVIVLDNEGIACATKSACSGAGGDGSSVVRAMTNDEARASSTLRFTLGGKTTMRDMTRVVDVLKQHVAKQKSS